MIGWRRWSWRRSANFCSRFSTRLRLTRVSARLRSAARLLVETRTSSRMSMSDFGSTMSRGTPALNDLEPLLRRLASTVDAVGFDAPWGRWFFAQYADGRQLDVAAQRASTAQRRPPDSIVLLDLDGILEARAARKPADRRAEWAFLAWFELGNVPKYIARGSMWEALGALEQARSEFLRLYAANMGAVNPEFGVTSILDAPGGDVPPRLAKTYPSPDVEEIREAARVLAGLLTDAWERPPLGEWVETEL